MSLSKLVLATVGLTLLISLMIAWFLPSVADFKPENPFWNGLKLFSQRSGITIMESWDELSELGNQVLVTIPYSPYRGEELERIRQFVTAGGVLVILDDFGHGNSILDNLGIATRFRQAPLLDPLFNFKNADFPKVVDFAGRTKDKGLNAIVMNRAATLTQIDPATVLAWSSQSSFLDLNGNGLLDENEPRGPLPVAAELGLVKGRIILVSDPSILINGIIDKADNYSFIEQVFGFGEKPVLLEQSHIPSLPLDRAHQELSRIRRILAAPYAEIGLVLLAVVITLKPIWLRRLVRSGNG